MNFEVVLKSITIGSSEKHGCSSFAGLLGWVPHGLGMGQHVATRGVPG